MIFIIVSSLKVCRSTSTTGDFVCPAVQCPLLHWVYIDLEARTGWSLHYSKWNVAQKGDNILLTSFTISCTDRLKHSLIGVWCFRRSVIFANTCQQLKYNTGYIYLKLFLSLFSYIVLSFSFPSPSESCCSTSCPRQVNPQPPALSQVEDNTQCPASSTAVVTSESTQQKRKIAQLEGMLQVLESGHLVKQRYENHHWYYHVVLSAHRLQGNKLLHVERTGYQENHDIVQ